MVGWFEAKQRPLSSDRHRRRRGHARPVSAARALFVPACTSTRSSTLYIESPLPRPRARPHAARARWPRPPGRTTTSWSAASTPRMPPASGCTRAWVSRIPAPSGRRGSNSAAGSTSFCQRIRATPAAPVDALKPIRALRQTGMNMFKKTFACAALLCARSPRPRLQTGRRLLLRSG